MRQYATLIQSPAVCGILAMTATVATVYQGVCLIAWKPAPSYLRASFALCGFVAVAFWQRKTLLRRPRRIDGMAIGIMVARFLAGVFGLGLVAALLYPLFFPQHACLCPRRTPQGNLKWIALGYLQYVQDYDNHLPPPGTTIENRKAMDPYLMSDFVWLNSSDNGENGVFVPNRDVLGHSLADFPNSKSGSNRAVLAYADHTDVSRENGTTFRYVAFIDGSVEMLSESRFQILLRKTATQAAKTSSGKRE